MFVVGISASPRKNENSEKILKFALDEFKKRGHETKEVLLSETKIGPCIACGCCGEKGKCANDEKASYVNNLLRHADGILAITPVYFGSMSAQMKALCDKTLPLRRGGFLLKGKLGGAIAVGKSRNGGQELTVKDIHSWMLVHGMHIVGDSTHFGGTVVCEFEDDSIGKESVIGIVDAFSEAREI
ncbi:MAG: flavodoxin family protein [Candidatus Nanoarchaeia archaeon]